ncbi:inorganic phosphate transporter [Membranicola marinus]|uniref:Phosphate transporter n=1 Tax=Membranihabitans marinus TaxID=1227546 RepID=A0A953HLR8_9BACT|nr:inorganic phosphate transporter [Membranihabitans marinus]MBY5957997.1 inorganic phosphate transporter [Membranihabitans marinus]
MEIFYLVLVVILFVLAISDLVVGVSNDAVNFLNSAVGSKAAPFKVIMFVAAMGVLVGATFSGGMMEVARKGIFHPEYFYFSEIILIFLAVMVTDVILLDTFNSYGMPTSTTVSIVFELLGAAVAMSLIKVFMDPDAMHLHEYINNGKALAIIGGILMSVAIAFTIGALIQYISRFIFSFDYENRMRKIGPLFGGIGIMAITYFMLIKGVKGASFMSDELTQTIQENTGMILLISLIGWTVILFALNRLFKIDILKVLVLVGTFALAMAFAGNDLVNFIGVPLAAYNSYEIFKASGAEADAFLMDGLAGEVATPAILLAGAGIIMVITLYFSKKAQAVVKTSLDLGRQDEGYERFSSYMLSRSLVRNVSAVGEVVRKNVPIKVRKVFRRQFDERPFTEKQQKLKNDAPVFDMLRASVTLVVASILIAVGTNFKLPLSTTYVTFMVFMGASLADGAWGRESAVYRVSGVLSVIGGWFFTAFSAFTVAFLLALIFYFTGIIGIVAVLIVAGIAVYRTHSTHSKRIADLEEFERRSMDGGLNRAKIIDLCITQIENFLVKYDEAVSKSLKALKKEDRSGLNDAKQVFEPTRKKIEWRQLQSSKILDDVPEDELEAGHLYIIVIDYLHELALQTESILKSSYKHVDNNHKPLIAEQIDELQEMHEMIKDLFNQIIEIFKTLDVEKAREYASRLQQYASRIRDIRKKQIKRIKKRKVGTRNSILYLHLLGEFRNMTLFAHRILRVLEDLIIDHAEQDGVDIKEIKEELERIQLAGEELERE